MNLFSLHLFFFVILTFLIMGGVFAQPAVDDPFTRAISGFRYGNEDVPTGKEWESPQDLSLNKELPKAYFFSFATKDQARAVLPEKSPYWMSLDGTWKFNWVKHPEERIRDFHQPNFDVSKWDNVPVPMSWNILGIQQDGSLKYGVPIYVNQKVIFQHSVRADDWRGGVMRTPPVDWTTYVYRNEVGSYRREFTIPQSWEGREIFINFDGVDSFFYLWVNGRYVGFSKNSRNLASFNISSFLNKKGNNTVAVEVYRNSDASFLEAQDMFRLPGIFRTVSLISKPTVHVRDLIVTPDLTDNYKNGKLSINACVRNSGKKKIEGYRIDYKLYANSLYKDDNVLVEGVHGQGELMQVIPNSCVGLSTVMEMKNPNLWSAEQPYRYTLVAELKDAKGRTVEVVSTIIGFRKVEIKDTEGEDDEFGLKGRYYYVNGKTVKLKGVNRHETNPEKGKVVSRQQMEEEVKLLKRANINHVRNAHYPNDPYWYFLCDKYGIYLEDEANVESHQYYYGEASTSHPREWKDAHVARNLEMVHATINHPSVVIWSLGNEAGPGNNFLEAYKAIKAVDLSRPVQYERNNNIVDMGSNQYPSVSWVQGAVKGTFNLKYPFHISEYAHSMGNATGNLIDYWEAIESTNFFMGGALWDWIDQSMYSYDKNTGEKFFAYGGDFGDKPNDGTFVNNGLIFADRKEKPSYYEVKKVYQNVAVKPTDIQGGRVEIFNKNYFTSLEDYEMEWALFEDGVEIARSTFGDGLSIGPRQKQIVKIPLDFSKMKAQSEYFVKIQFILPQDEFWADKGYVQMEEQILLKNAESRPSIAVMATGAALRMRTESFLQVIEGDGFVAKFDKQTGSIYSLNYGNDQIIRDGQGPRLDGFRAPLDNDNWIYKQWFEKGLHNLQHNVLSETVYPRSDGALVLSFLVESQAPNGASIHGGTSGNYTIQEHREQLFNRNDFKFSTNQIWTVYKDGSIELESIITSNDENFVLGRLGYALELPSSLHRYTYYGRGPANNYADRKTSQNIELHRSTVEGQFVDWPNPQSMSNNEEVRWVSLTNDAGNGVVFVAKDLLATSALQWSELEVTMASHPYKLPESSGTHLHLDVAVTGLGGNSCGQGPPLEQDRVKAQTRSLGFIIRPVIGGDFMEKVRVSAAGDMPLNLSRSSFGELSIVSERKEAVILYQVGEEKVQVYRQPFNLRNGGTVRAWYQDNASIHAVLDYPRIESIPTLVVFASSEEASGGSAKNLTDGNSSSIWHTMYSVTVAKYPHWVDFDAGETKQIKGFTYLPRQDGDINGNVKEYRIEVSNNGRDWIEAVKKGSFPNNTKQQVVRFDRAVTGRYLRFTALSSQNGQDFAAGAEFMVLAD